MVKLKDLQPVIRSATDNTWVFITLLTILILLGISRFIFQKNYFTLSSLNEFIDNQENFLPFAFFTNFLLGILSGMLIYPMVDLPYNLGNWTVLVHVCILISGVILYLLLKFLINGFLAYLVGMGEGFKKIMKVKVFFRFFAIIGLLICNFMLYYSDFEEVVVFFVAVFILCITLVLEYVFQLTKSDITRVYGSYYFILYLCALEILPVLYVVMHWNRMIR